MSKSTLPTQTAARYVRYVIHIMPTFLYILLTNKTYITTFHVTFAEN
jgi:hypothetical protein